MLWEAAAVLAKWFHFQPSEIDGLDVREFTAWVRQANRQISAMVGD
ncbi:MAG: GpE family phage tail protein [Candidatus Hydrogenedens sp.]|nr:GpE family phage tail protein [Candidatus Hydrogenedentota bacterium]NLF56567.1 GpE family phage tail protein [Candidatus Hydrogenedens sp.]